MEKVYKKKYTYYIRRCLLARNGARIRKENPRVLYREKKIRGKVLHEIYTSHSNTDVGGEIINSRRGLPPHPTPESQGTDVLVQVLFVLAILRGKV